MNHLDFKLRYEAPFSRLFAAVRRWSVAQIFDFIRCDFVADHLSLSTVTALNTRWHGRHLTWMWIQPSGDYEQELRLAFVGVLPSLDCWQRAPAPFFFSQQINTLKFRIWRHICLLIQFGVAASTCLYSNPGFHLVHVQFYPLGMTHVSGRCRCRAGLLRLKHSVMSWWRSGVPSLFCVFYYALFPHKYFKYFLLIS